MNATETAAPDQSANDGADDPGPSPGPISDTDQQEAPEDDVPPEPARIELIDRGGRPVDLAWLTAYVTDAAAQVGDVRRLAVRLVDDTQMTALHERHRGDATTTDVLAFPASSPGEPVDADIAVCVDVAARVAAEREHTVERELLLYILHALLHCVGYDDHADADFAAMHAREDEILAAIGVGVTFRGGPRS